MRKKQAAMAMFLALTLTAGCTPGTVREYTAKAQRAGEQIFEGKTEDVLAERTETAGTETAGIEPAAGEEAESAGDVRHTEDAGSTDDAERSMEELESAAEPGRTEEPESAEEMERAEETAADTPAADSVTVVMPAFMSEVPEEIAGLMEQKAADFTGKLAGRDELFWTEETALETVLLQERYDDKMLCIQNMVHYGEGEKGSFLLIFESTPLTARQRVQGDLWYFDGETAKKLLDDEVFMSVQLVTGQTEPYLAVRMQKENQEKAAVYTAARGEAQAFFTDAVSVHAADGGIRVDYLVEAFQYDPLVGEWSDGTGTAAYFYERTAEGFAPFIWKELSAQEYLAYVQGTEEDTAAAEYRKELEERFYTASKDGSEYAYEFFALGDGQIGYRQRRVGEASENSGEIGHAVAEYTWQIFALDNGKLTKDSISVSGEGYYFEDRAERKQELEGLDEVPAWLQKQQIGAARQTMYAAERKALDAVLSAQEYPEDALCFVSAADFDGDGTKEAFAAVGGYDGAFGAPVCDLWYAQDTAQLLAEGIPLKGLEKTGTGTAAAQLLKGYENGGKSDLLFTVKDGVPVRCLENMGSFSADGSGDLLARAAGKEPSAPEYFHMENGEAVPYGTSEIPLETILDYENGEAVYGALLRQAEKDPAKISCLQRENGLIHVTFSDGDSRFYETYEILNEKLVLKDSGSGGYTKPTDTEKE